MKQATDVAQLRRHGLWLSRLTLFLLSATAILVVGPHIRIFSIVVSAGRDPMPGLIHSLVHSSPAFFYLYALWAIRGAFRDLAGGVLFGTSIARGCTRTGIALAIGATMSAIGVPNLLRILHQADIIGRPKGFAGVLVFDVAYLAVGVVGLALVLLGRLVGRAAEVQREAAALRNELDEFF